nr:MAG TPA: hypothetical protein [Caudoviricetes sp.]
MGYIAVDIPHFIFSLFYFLAYSKQIPIFLMRSYETFETIQVFNHEKNK